MLESGRQSIIKHKDNIVLKIYKEVMNGNDNQLVLLLKKYFETTWKTEYEKSCPWFIAFLEKYDHGENRPIYDRVLNRSAEYGKTYMKSFPVLSIVLQFVLFEEVTDDKSKENDIFEELWFSVTNDGLQSIDWYSDYIVRRTLHEQRKIPSTLFQSLREYYRDDVFESLKSSNVMYRGNLYESVLDNVAEYGWSTDLKLIKDNFSPSSLKTLLEKLRSFHQKQKRLSATNVMVMIGSTMKEESAYMDTTSEENKGNNEV